MSITPNPAADFSPVINGYSGIQPFRFWCQKVLPLVYDDSLSYYELLNKVVDYLNHTIEDVATAESNIDAIATAYNQLQAYVNNYFDSLDVQTEINNKLNDMARSGELDELLSPIVAEQIGGVVEDQIDAVVANQIDEVVADQIDDVVGDQLPAQVQTQVPSVVTSWLDDNVDPVGSAVVVDSSLSIAGAAADAKATGDFDADLKSAINEISDNIFDGTYTSVTDLYINTTNRKLTQSSSTPSLVLIIIPIQANTNYIVWKKTSTIMRIATGTIQSPVDGDPCTRVAYHSEASSDPLQITSGENDAYMYIQLYANSDSLSLRSVEANIGTLMVCKDNYATVSETLDTIDDRLDTIENTFFARRAGIESGGDLNDYTVMGIYGIANTATIVNAPTTDTGRRYLCVYGGGGFTPVIYQAYFNLNTHKTYMRQYSDHVWRDWQDMNTNTSDVQNVIDKNNPLIMRYRQPNSRRFNFAKGKMWQYMWDTMPAFEAAMEDSDCWSVNIDVRETADGELVCFHNATVGNGFTNCADQTAKIEDMTFAETQEFDVIKGVWNGSTWLQGNPVKIPKLIDVLNLVRSYGKVCVIETKAKDTTNISSLTETGMQNLVNLVIRCGMMQGCGFMCGNSGNTWLLENYPECVRVYGVDTITTDYIAARLTDHNAVFMAHNSSLTDTVLSYARSNNVLIGGYTPRTTNDEDDDMVEKNLDVISIHQAPPV